MYRADFLGRDRLLYFCSRVVMNISLERVSLLLRSVESAALAFVPPLFPSLPFPWSNLGKLGGFYEGCSLPVHSPPEVRTCRKTFSFPDCFPAALGWIVMEDRNAAFFLSPLLDEGAIFFSAVSGVGTVSLLLLQHLD